MAGRSVDGSSTGTPVDEIGGTDVSTRKRETGTFLGEFPYVRFGNGPEDLMILPGITLENEPPGPTASASAASRMATQSTRSTAVAACLRTTRPGSWRRTTPG
jgi:hypothetical protein